MKGISALQIDFCHRKQVSVDSEKFILYFLYNFKKVVVERLCSKC